jgi:ABC-type antimicrobial peptide transport system permease subunit
VPEVHAASSAALPLSFTVPGPVLLAVVVAVVAAILIAAVIPAHQLGDLDPIAALAVE